MKVLTDRSYIWVLLGSSTGRDGDKASCACICHDDEIWFCYFVSFIVFFFLVNVSFDRIESSEWDKVEDKGWW